MAETPKFPTITEIPEEPTTGAGSLAPASEIPQEPEIQEPEPVTEPVVEPVAEIVEEPVTPEPVEPEPAEVVEPVVVEPTVETTVEPVIETPTPVVAEEPTKTADTKVETVQDIKAKETSNEAQENELNETKKNQVVSEMQKMIQNGSTLEEIAAYGTKNIQFKDDINTVLRGSFKNLANAKYFGKYSTLNNEDMYAAYQSGLVVPGSEQYNLLPPEKKSSFDAYLKEQEASNLSSKTDFTASEKVTDLTYLESQISKMYSSTARENYNKTLNSEQFITLSNQITQKKIELEKMDIEMEDLQEDLEKELAGTGLAASVRAKSTQAYKTAVKDKRLALAEYNAYVGQYQTLKSNAETELEIAMYEDSIAREQYQTELSIYESRRLEMKEDERLEFEAKSSLLAEQREFDMKKQLISFQDKLSKDNLQGGDYIDNGKGDLVYVKNGQEISVLEGLGTVKGNSQDSNYKYTTYNEGGVITVVGTPLKEGLNPFIKNYNASGESATNYVQSIGSGTITSYGGEHDNYQGLDIDGNIGDPITLPLSGTIIESQKHDLYGNTVVVQTQDGNTIRYSHLDKIFGKKGESLSQGSTIGTIGNTGNVVAFPGGDGSHLDIVTTQPNGTTRTSRETEQYLLGLGGGQEQEFTGEFEQNKVPLYAKFNAGKMSQTQELKYADDEEFLNQALAYGQEKAKPGFQKMEDLITLAESLKGLGPIDRGLPDNAVDINKILGRAGMNELIDLKSQGATFGSLTEKEFDRIQSSVLNVGTFTSAGKWDQILDDYISTLKRGLPDDYEFQNTTETTETPEELESTLSDFNKHKNKVDRSYLN